MQNALPITFRMFILSETFMDSFVFPWARKIAMPELYTASRGNESAVMAKYSAALSITAVSTRPYSTPRNRRPPARKNSITAVMAETVMKYSWPPARAARALSPAPISWAQTTVPPAHRAKSTCMNRLLSASTSDTPEIAASPRTATISTSAMPTRTLSSCSTSSGPISAVSFFLSNKGISGTRLAIIRDFVFSV